MIADPCAPHRPYIAAIVDGERSIVPWRTRWHVRRCRNCGGELRAHRALDARMRGLAALKPPADSERGDARE